MNIRPLVTLLAVGMFSACQHMNFDDIEQEDKPSSGNIEQPLHTGQGTLAAPYTITDFLEKDSITGTCWVIGYAVGSTYSTMSNASFSVPTDNKTNILLAADSTCDEASLCIPVELKSTSMRDGFNLANHPEHLGHCIMVCGTKGKYFSHPGLRNATKAKWFPDLDINEISPLPQNWEEADYSY